MTKCKLFLSLTAVELCAAVGILAYSYMVSKNRDDVELPQKVVLVESLALTDLAIWTEARYTRHPSQADFFTPFQDFPSALEHFPAGSVVSPQAVEDKVARPGPHDPRE